MAVEKISNFLQPLEPGKKNNSLAESENVPSFGETLKKFVTDVNNLQQDAAGSVQKLATGQTDNLHEVMIAVEKAGVSFELMMEIRNKMLEAYHELMRMQL